jgi:hypothetical protein
LDGIVEREYKEADPQASVVLFGVDDDFSGVFFLVYGQEHSSLARRRKQKGGLGKANKKRLY